MGFLGIQWMSSHNNFIYIRNIHIVGSLEEGANSRSGTGNHKSGGNMGERNLSGPSFSHVKMTRWHLNPLHSKLNSCALRFRQFGKGWTEPRMGFQCFWASFPLVLSGSWETVASMLMADRQPSAWALLHLPPPGGHPGPSRYRTAPSSKSWSMQLPAKHHFLFFIHSLNKDLSPICNVPDTTIYTVVNKTRNGTCPHVACSQPGELDIKIPLFSR